MTTALAPAPPTAVTEAGTVQVVALRNPFLTERTCYEFPAGVSLATIVDACRLRWGAAVYLEAPDGRVHGPYRTPAAWRRIRPRAGTRCLVRATVMGGGGGDENKTLRTILMVVVILVAIVILVISYGSATPATFALIAWAVGVGVGLSFVLINALLPPQLPKLGNLAALAQGPAGAAESPVLSITGSRNRATPYGPIPLILGQRDVYPPFR